MATSEPDPQDETPRDETPQDETKRKFREALERKKAKSSGGTAHRDGSTKQSHAHGPATGRREFRRKSG